MAASEHDRLALRLAEILLRLNQGDKVSRNELAQEFKVSERTVYRDLNRLGSIVDRLEDGRYQLAAHYRGKLSPKDLKTFAQLTGVSQLFPDTSQRFLLALLDTLSESSFLVKGPEYEALKPQEKSFQQLSHAIKKNYTCWVTYTDKRRCLHPYRLVNYKGIWYLAAVEDNQLKAFTFSRIRELVIRDESFVVDQGVQKRIEEEDSIWYGDKTEVLVKVAPEAAYYFKRRNLFPEQEIVKELETGGLILTSQVSHSNQILPLVRYWIPQINILEPVWLREKLIKELSGYIGL